MEARYVLGPSTPIKLDCNEWTEIRWGEEDESRGQGTGWTFLNDLFRHTHETGQYVLEKRRDKLNKTIILKTIMKIFTEGVDWSTNLLRKMNEPTSSRLHVSGDLVSVCFWGSREGVIFIQIRVVVPHIWHNETLDRSFRRLQNIIESSDKYLVGF